MQKLEEQKARYGINTPPEILIEIEDIEAEIQKLKAHWAELLGKENERLLNEVSEAIAKEKSLLGEIESLRKRILELETENKKLLQNRFENEDIFDAQNKLSVRKPSVDQLFLSKYDRTGLSDLIINAHQVISVVFIMLHNLYELIIFLLTFLLYFDLMNFVVYKN